MPKNSSQYVFRLCAGVYLALLAHPSVAGADAVVEGDFLAEIPFVLTASRISQSPLDAPAPVTLIDRDTILNSGFTEIHDIFRLVPGFLVADWPKGSPVVVNQGLGEAKSRRLLVLLDGRALYDPYKGGVDWQELPLRLEDIERIEVVRGPNPASYGANAFQGVINIITRVPLGENEQGLLLRAGRRDIGELYAFMTRGQDDLNWRISASAREATNFRDVGRKDEYNEAIQRQVFNGQLNKSLRGNEELSFRLGVSNGENDIGKQTDPSEPLRSANVRDMFFDVGWKRFYAENSEVSVRFYHYDRKERDSFDVFPRNPALAPVASLRIRNDVDVRRDDIEFQQIHAFSGSLKGLWGAGLRNDAAESSGGLYGLGSVGGWQGQVFGNLDWEAGPNWLLHAGGMVEKHYNTDTLFSPRLALNFRISSEQSLRFSVGRGYRAPTIFEQNAREMVTWSGGIADIVHYSSRELEPEKTDYAELGYVAHLQPQGLRIDARIYINKSSNFIDEQSCVLDADTKAVNDLVGGGYGVNCAFSEPAGYERPLGYSGKSAFEGGPSRYGHFKAFYFYNAGNLRVRGGDIGLDWRHPNWGRFRVGHAVTRISASGLGHDVETNINNISKDVDAEMSAPQHASSLLWSKRFPGGLRLSLGGYWVGKMIWPNEGDDQPAYRRFDLQVGKVLKLLGKDDELSFTVQNFNSEHTEFREEYLVERRAFLTYSVNY